MTNYVMFKVSTPDHILMQYKCIRSKRDALIYFSTDYTGSKYTPCYVAFDVPEDEVIVLTLQGYITCRIEPTNIHPYLMQKLRDAWRWRDFQ